MSPQDKVHVRALLDDESWTEARNFLLQLEHAEDDVEWHALCAEVETGDGKLEVAAALYERILERHPEHRGALYNASLVFSDLGRHDDAMEALELLVELEGESAGVLNDLSYEYMESGHNVPARLAAARAEQTAADEAQRCLARLNGATALANMSRHAEARGLLDELLRQCTGACGERESALELRQSLEPAGAARSSARAAR